jgi:hypothetical protein
MWGMVGDGKRIHTNCVNSLFMLFHSRFMYAHIFVSARVCVVCVICRWNERELSVIVSGGMVGDGKRIHTNCVNSLFMLFHSRFMYLFDRCCKFWRLVFCHYLVRNKSVNTTGNNFTCQFTRQTSCFDYVQ